MRNLIEFLVRNHAILLFIFLESIAIRLIVTYNDHQKSTYISSSSKVSGWIFEFKEQTVGFFDLKDQNNRLLFENKQLREKLFDLKLVSEENLANKTVNDSVSHQRYHLITATVISNSTSLINNYITLNKGRKDGIVLHSGVIDDFGIIGVINNVSDDYSTAISILNPNLSLSASVKSNGFFGNLSWDGKNSLLMNLDAIPKHAEVNVGDEVITNGYSTKFPKDITIGKVESFKIEDGSNFYSIKVRLNNEFGNLDYVYVVKDLDRILIDSLKSLNNE